MQERRCALAPLSARAIALNSLEFHLRSKICVSEIVAEAWEMSHLGYNKLKAG